MVSIKPYLKLARIDHGIMVALAIFTGAFVAKRLEVLVEKELMFRLMIGIISGILVEIGTFTFNDYFNIEEDKVNAPDRPLVTGEISLRNAFYFGSLTIISGVLLNILISIPIFLLILFTVFIGMMYNAYLKKRGFIGNILVAYSTALPFFYGALITGKNFEMPTFNVMLFTFIAFFAALGREIVKGIRDIEGDRRVNVQTLAITIGCRKAAFFAACFFTLAVVLSVCAIRFVDNLLAYLLALLPTDAIFLYASYSIIKSPIVSNAEKIRKSTLMGMLLGITSFLLSATP